MSRDIRAGQQRSELAFSGRPSRMLLWAFFGLAFALAWAAWVPAAVLFHSADRPGPPSLTSCFMVLQAVGAAAPTVAAYTLLRANGQQNLIRWIVGRYKTWRVHMAWYVTAALLTPVITLASLGIRGLADPNFQVAPTSPFGEMLGDLGWVGIVLIPLLVLGQLPSSPLLEEFGWRGFALPALQARRTALTSSVVLGLAWGVWHLPLTIAYREPVIPTLMLIVAHTVLMTWIVNSTDGSMLLALLFHAGLNTALTTLSVGSPSMVEVTLTWLITIFVIIRYGPRDLGRDRVKLPVGSGGSSLT